MTKDNKLPEGDTPDWRERFDEEFGDIQKYHPAYWGQADEDGTQTAVPNKITEESDNIKAFIEQTISKELEKQKEEIIDDKYSISEFTYWLEKYNDIYDKKWTQAEMITIIAKAMINFFPETNTRY